MRLSGARRMSAMRIALVLLSIAFAACGADRSAGAATESAPSAVVERSPQSPAPAPAAAIPGEVSLDIAELI